MSGQDYTMRPDAYYLRNNNRLILFESFPCKLEDDTEIDLVLVYRWEVFHLQCFLLAKLQSHLIVNFSFQIFTFEFIRIRQVCLIPNSF